MPTPFSMLLIGLPTLPASAAVSDMWSTLDRQLESVAAVPAQPPAGVQITGWLRTRYANSSDVDVDPSTAGEQSLGGFDLDSARLVFSAAVSEDVACTLSVEAGNAAVSDASGDGLALLDAYAAVRLADWASVSVGRFSATFLWSSCIEERNLLFLDRSFVGEALDGRDVGFELSGAIDRFNWWAAAQNGSDSVGNELALSARASYRILGDGPATREGAQGLGSSNLLTAGVAWFDDGQLDSGSIVGADVFFAQGRWSASAELVDFDDDVMPTGTIDTSTGVVIPGAAAATGAQTPWNATVGFMIVPDSWEVAARWQDLDDDAGTTIASLAVNRYVVGHNVKWTLQLDSADSDDDTLSADTFALGLTGGF